MKEWYSNKDVGVFFDDIPHVGIRYFVPNMSEDVVEKQKTLQSGTCVAFGRIFKIPMIVKMEMPNPMPYSSNCNVSSCWR